VLIDDEGPSPDDMNLGVVNAAPGDPMLGPVTPPRAGGTIPRGGLSTGGNLPGGCSEAGLGGGEALRGELAGEESELAGVEMEPPG